MNLIFCVTIMIVQLINMYQFTAVKLICLQIGDVRSIIFYAPIHGEMLNIKLPPEYHGMSLKAEYLPKSHPAYSNPLIKMDDMFPCRLSDSTHDNQHSEELLHAIEGKGEAAPNTYGVTHEKNFTNITNVEAETI